jgi:hypothetical protein
MIEVKKEDFGHFMEKDHKGGIEELKRRRPLIEGTIQRILLTFF